MSEWVISSASKSSWKDYVIHELKIKRVKLTTRQSSTTMPSQRRTWRFMLEHVTRKQGPRRGQNCLPNSRSLQRTWLKNLGFSIYMNSLWPILRKIPKTIQKCNLWTRIFRKQRETEIFYHKYQYFKNWINSVIRKKPKLFFKKRFCVVFHSAKKMKSRKCENPTHYSWLLITRTLANSNLALTRTKVDFPWISLLHLL